MPARQRGKRATGPFRNGKGWRIFLFDEEGTRTPQPCATAEEGEKIVRDYNLVAAADPSFAKYRNVDETIDAYEAYLKEKGNEPVGVKETARRMRCFFLDLDLQLTALTNAVCREYYKNLQTRSYRAGTDEAGNPVMKKYAADSHRNILLQARSMLHWAHEQKWVKENPLTGIKGIGKRKKGPESKPQLRIDEARQWLDVALDLAKKGDAGAQAAYLTLMTGMCCSEITNAEVRDLDDGGTKLWVAKGKTENRRNRPVIVPDALQAPLLKLAANRPPTSHLFGDHWRDWVRKQVKRICREAGVMEVSAHSMRGLNATLDSVDAVARGRSAATIAANLGHGSETVSQESYADKTKVKAARQARTLKVLKGGA